MENDNFVGLFNIKNYSALEDAIAAFNRMLNTAKADAEKELEDLFDALKEEDYTKDQMSVKEYRDPFTGAMK